MGRARDIASGSLGFHTGWEAKSGRVVWPEFQGQCLCLQPWLSWPLIFALPTAGKHFMELGPEKSRVMWVWICAGTELAGMLIWGEFRNLAMSCSLSTCPWSSAGPLECVERNTHLPFPLRLLKSLHGTFPAKKRLTGDC